MDLLKKGKKAIDCQNHSEIKNLYLQTQNVNHRINLSDVFLKLFYYACQKERKELYHILTTNVYGIFFRYTPDRAQTEFFLWQI